MEAWEYIIAETIMEYDRERRRSNQTNRQPHNANVGAGGLIAVIILWIILCIIICRIF